MDPLERQRLADDGKLLDEAVDLPERLVAGAVRSSAAELVVEDDPTSVAEALELLEVVVREAWAAVEAEERHA
jgi:hypothetical protein